MKKFIALMITGTVLVLGACAEVEAEEVTKKCEAVGAICGFHINENK